MVWEETEMGKSQGVPGTTEKGRKPREEATRGPDSSGEPGSFGDERSEEKRREKRGRQSRKGSPKGGPKKGRTPSPDFPTDGKKKEVRRPEDEEKARRKSPSEKGVESWEKGLVPERTNGNLEENEIGSAEKKIEETGGGDACRQEKVAKWKGEDPGHGARSKRSGKSP
jgi:hypothetical protein